MSHRSTTNGTVIAPSLKAPSEHCDCPNLLHSSLLTSDRLVLHNLYHVYHVKRSTYGSTSTFFLAGPMFSLSTLWFNVKFIQLLMLRWHVCMALKQRNTPKPQHSHHSASLVFSFHQASPPLTHLSSSRGLVPHVGVGWRFFFRTEASSSLTS